jgi:hypothetical protein
MELSSRHRHDIVTTLLIYRHRMYMWKCMRNQLSILIRYHHDIVDIDDNEIGLGIGHVGFKQEVS